MDLDAISVFVKVVEAGSFSGAARLLKMPKTTVSAKVAALEKRLGVNLIQRTTRKLFVTEAGQRYFQHCAAAVWAVEQGESELLAAKTQPIGLLRITAPVDIGHTLLPRIVRAYLEKYPDTTCELLISNSVVDVVGEGIDLAIRAGHLKDSTLVGKRFLGLSGNLYAAPGYLQGVPHITHPRELSQLRFVSFTDTGSIDLRKDGIHVQVPVTSRVQADDLETVKSLLLLGEGIAWLPDFLAFDAMAEGTLVPVLPDWTSTQGGAVYFVYAGHKYPSPKVQAFMATALEITAGPLQG